MKTHVLQSAYGFLVFAFCWVFSPTFLYICTDRIHFYKLHTDPRTHLTAFKQIASSVQLKKSFVRWSER